MIGGLVSPALAPALALVLVLGAPQGPAPASTKPVAPAAASIPLPPPPVPRPRPAPATRLGEVPLPPPPVLRTRAAADVAEGERLVEAKCAKCHGAFLASSGLTDALWKSHMKRAAVTDEQARKIRAALEARRARAVSR